MAEVKWTDAARRQVAPRRGWTEVVARAADAKAPYARIRAVFAKSATALDGATHPPANVTRTSAARAAFAEAKSQAPLDEAVQADACALVGRQDIWHDGGREADFIKYWAARAGLAFALRTFARRDAVFIRFVAKHLHDVQELAIVDQEVTIPSWFRHDQEGVWRALRHEVLAREEERTSNETLAEVLREHASLETRALLAMAFERADWARADLDAVRATGVYGAHFPFAFRLYLLTSSAADFVKDASQIYWEPHLRHTYALPLRYDFLATYGEAAVAPLSSLIADRLDARSARSFGEPLSLVESSEVAVFFAQTLAFKEVQPIAVEYLQTHPALSIPALERIAGAKGSLGDAARAIVKPLLAASAPDQDAAVLASADELPDVLRAPPWTTKNEPKKLPTLPAFFIPAGLSRPLLVNGHALPDTAVTTFATMLAFTSFDDPYSGIALVRAACDPASLAAFAWDLFEAWLVAGANSKEAWAMHSLGLLGNDDTARRLTPLIRAWPGEAAHARAVSGLGVLARIGTDTALMHLHGIAQKVKFKGLQDKAREKIDQIAEARGFSADELADRLVPDLELDESGAKWLDFGPRRFKVVFDEQLRAGVVGESGKRMSDLPKAGKNDDAEKAKAATDAWRVLKKDAKAIAQSQLLRLELAMCNQRRWSPEVFDQLLRGHPLLVHLVRRLVWGVYGDHGELTATFRVAEDASLANESDEPFALATDAHVGIVHRLDLTDALARQWGESLSDYEILQPFEQLSRAAIVLTDVERAGIEIARVEGLTVPTGRVLGLDGRGWRRGPPQDAGIVGWYEKPLPNGLTALLDLTPGIYAGMISESPEQTLGKVTVSEDRWSETGTVPLDRLSAIVFSELSRDLESLRPA